MSHPFELLLGCLHLLLVSVTIHLRFGIFTYSLSFEIVIVTVYFRHSVVPSIL
jgi:hypothetical protein